MSEERNASSLAAQHGIEVELINETRTAPFHDSTWRMLEVWTQNSIYAIDSSMRCFDVIDRGSLRPLAEHALLGARLVGGQLQTDKGVELSHPFPLPGMEAVFERVMRGGAASFSYSSAVNRVVMRLRRVNVEGATTPLWGELSASPSIRPPATSNPSIAPTPSVPPAAASNPPAAVSAPAVIPNIPPLVTDIDDFGK
jgi:hypothetical protein